MPKGIKRIREGSTVRVRIKPPRGEKLVYRPAVVITPNSEIDSRDSIEVIGITHSHHPDDDVVPLPWHPEGKCATGLTYDSAAVLCWIVRVKKRDAKPMGHIPKSRLAEILCRLKKYLDP